ncbi:MAG: hypothetical protein CBD00_07660 [Rhodospirillaceae bacterium TMED140]|nr:MAG: hypothetical protein CBD00_07660 [Rhodospirillaceae bacterium TMED140]
MLFSAAFCAFLSCLVARLMSLVLNMPLRLASRSCCFIFLYLAWSFLYAGCSSSVSVLLLLLSLSELKISALPSM